MANPITGVDITKFPSDILYNSGVLYAASTKVGATKGPPKFDPGRTWQNVDFDGKYAPVKLLDRAINGEPTLSLTLMEFGNTTTGAQMAKLEPAASSATASTITTWTPVLAGGFLIAGNYITDLRCIWERGFDGSGNYFAVYFPFALCIKYDLSGNDTSQAMISATFAGRIDLATDQVTTAAYKFEYRTALP